MAGLCWRYDEEDQYLATISHDEELGRVIFVISVVNHAFSLAPVRKRLERLLSKDVVLAPDCVGPEVDALVAGIRTVQEVFA